MRSHQSELATRISQRPETELPSPLEGSRQEETMAGEQKKDTKEEKGEITDNYSNRGGFNCLLVGWLVGFLMEIRM